MKASIHSFFATVACLLLLPCAGAATPIERTLPAAHDAQVEINNVLGSIRVEGWQRNEIEITGTLGDGSEGLAVTENDGQVEITVELPGRGLFKGRQVEDSHLVIRVPRQARLEIDAVSAHVDVTDVHGSKLEIETVSGRVMARSNAARIEIETVSGAVTLQANAQEVGVETVSGSIAIAGSARAIDAESVSGTIRTTASDVGKLEASTVSGDIAISGDMAADVRLAAGSLSGDIRLQLPTGVAGQLHASSFSGRVNHAPGAGADEKGLQLQLGDGGTARLRVKTFSGDIDIEQ